MYHDEPCRRRGIVVEHGATLLVTEQAAARPTVASQGHRVGYASTLSNPSDVRAAVGELQRLGVKSEDIYIDRGTSGRSSERPLLTAALAACKSGDQLVVASFVRLSRSLGDLSRLVDMLQTKGVQLVVGGRLLAEIHSVELLTMISGFEADLIDAALAEDAWVHERRREQDQRRLRPALTALQAQHLRQLFDTRRYTAPQVGELFGVSRSSVFRLVGRVRGR